METLVNKSLYQILRCCIGLGIQQNTSHFSPVERLPRCERAAHFIARDGRSHESLKLFHIGNESLQFRVGFYHFESFCPPVHRRLWHFRKRSSNSINESLTHQPPASPCFAQNSGEQRSALRKGRDDSNYSEQVLCNSEHTTLSGALA